ncbi:hypothetical protein Tco_0878319 [Tanacetum coccineum]|uniref:Reverse transcriptase domain-containing protein n=1 Tax=Tanacetum coccineum TaxID=301880 RepID=A0ABQ5BZ67_9ASTR
MLNSPSSFPIHVVDSDSFFEEFDTSLSHLNNSLPEFETFSHHTEETRSGSTTTHANYSLTLILRKTFDSDSLIEEIDLFLTPNGSMPSGIENDDYNSKGDILFLKELLSNDSPSLHKNESFHFDVPSSPRPSVKPPDDEIYFEPDTEVFTKVVDDISDNSTRELYVHVPNILPTLPTLSSMFDTLLPFSSENEDKVLPLILSWL